MPVNCSIGAGTLIQIASGRAIDGHSIANYDLSFAPGVSLNTHIPTFAVIKYASGNLTTAALRLLADTVPITGSQVLTTINSTHNGYAPCVAGTSLTNDNSKVIKADVTAPSDAASTFDVIVYGIPLS